MPDNRRRHANTVPLAKFVLCLMIGSFALAAGLSYVWFRNQLYTVGEQIKKYEQELAQLKTRNVAAQSAIATLTSTKALQQHQNTGWLKLVPISGDHIVVVGNDLRHVGRGELQPVANERKTE